MNAPINNGTKDESDCGFKNHETLLIVLDIENSNGPNFANYWRRQALVADNQGRRYSDTDLADALKCHYAQKEDECVTLTPRATALPALGKCDVLGALLSAALERVDWLEIARHLQVE